MEQIKIIHGCITPLQYKVGQFTLSIWAWDHQKKKSLHFAKSTSPICLDHLVKSPSPHCWTQANSISPMLHCLQVTKFTSFSWLPKFSSNSLKLNIFPIAQWVKCIHLLPKLLPQKTKDYPIFKGSLIQKRAQTFALIYY